MSTSAMEMIVTADKTTLSVMGADGVRHIIHSDEFGIAAILDVLGKANADKKDAERYRFLRDKASPSDVETWWWGYLGIADPVPAATFDRLIDSAMQSESQPQARDGKETT